MKTVVVIPTYDEKDNVTPMAKAVLETSGAEVLFVDDNSPDGTGRIVDGLSVSEPRIHCLHRAQKEGLGRAYVAGFGKALEMGADRIVQMDCDFSHNPADLPRMLAEDADLVIGSRYVAGGGTPGWPFRRRLISRAGGIFIRTVTGMPLRDPTGGFKCWKADALRRIDFTTVESAGYSFQLEMNHRAWKAGCSIRELPIVFTDRARGYSKITPGIAVESIRIATKLRFGVVLLALLAALSAQAFPTDTRHPIKRNPPPPRIGTETEAQRTERMAWFTDARFGMFIHFGLYSLPAWHEWIKTRKVIWDEEYDRYFANFNPDLFDAREWVRKAKRAGMKYMVLTTKHHEGFCLWDTKFSDYKSTNTPFGRDIVREFVDACHAEGMHVGFYYSLLDWHHPDFTVDTIHPLRPRGERVWDGVGRNDRGYDELNAGRDFAKYRQYMKDQLTELLTNYGKVDLLWYDFSYPDRGKGWEQWDSLGLIELTRRLQPGIIVNDRLDLSDCEGGWDFVTIEQTKADKWPMRNGRRVPWETCQTFSGSWGYSRDEESWKTPEQLISLLGETVSKGGNLILNVGPTGRGDFDYRANERLDEMGEWMHWNARSIYGCTRAPDGFEAPEGSLLTWNPQTHRLYVILLEYPKGRLPCKFADRIEYAQFLHDASEVKIADGSFEITSVKPRLRMPVIEIRLKAESL